METNSFFKFTTRRPVAITMVTLAVVVFGIFSYRMLSWNLMPNISYPSFTIRTQYPGAAPEEVENQVAKPLEEQLSLIKNLVSITSVSRPEQCDIILELNWNTNLDQAAQEIREKLDQVTLSNEIKRPIILRYDPNLDPVLRLAVVSKIDPLKLRKIVEKEIAQELEGVEGVAAARVKGGLEKEILVKLDEKKMIANQISFAEVSSRLAQENVNLAGGNIEEGETKYLVRILNEFRSLKEMEAIVIASRQGAFIRLGEIAAIEYGGKEQKVITRINGIESIEIDVFKEADANIVTVARRVKNKIFPTPAQQAILKKNSDLSRLPPFISQQLKELLSVKLPSSIKIEILSDQSRFIENALQEVRNNAVVGGILAILILYLFLKNFAITSIISISIPLSIISTFAALKFFNVNLNLMSLGGLALGIGMLVDNSIVVIESIFRCRQEGDDLETSAVRGVDEVGGAIVASTLTTVAVFFPIVFVEGVAGQIFKDLSLAVVFSLLASLAVSLFLIPMLASRRIEKKENAAYARLRFRVVDQPGIKNLLFMPLEMIVFIVQICWRSCQFIFWSVILTLNVFSYPFSFKLTPFLTEKLSKFRTNSSQKIQLWDNFFNFDAYTNFFSSLASRKNILKKVLLFLPLTFNYFFNLLLTLFSRLAISLLAAAEVVFRFFIILFVITVAPLLKFSSSKFQNFFNQLSNWYKNILNLCLQSGKKLLLGIVAVFLITVFLILPRIGSELVPEIHQATLYLNIVHPVGTTVERNSLLLAELEKEISLFPEVEKTGYVAGTTEDDITSGEIGEHIGKITINLKRSKNIKKSEELLIEKIRGIMENKPDLKYSISRPVLFSLKAPIEVLLKGYNIDQLRLVAAELQEKLEKIEGLKDVRSSIKTGFPEVVIELDRLKLSHFNLNAYDVATLIKNKFDGYIATKFKEEDIRVDIRVRLQENQRQNIENLRSITVNPGQKIPLPLAEVANLTISSGPSEIRRLDQERTAVISANVQDISLNEAVLLIDRELASYSFPPGFRYEIAGQNREMASSLGSLKLAMFLAIFLVYIVMASQFESFLHPLLIMLTVPLALIGVFLTLFILDIPLSITAYIGIITLVGIVVNNAIVLISYINLLRAKGAEKLEAISQAAIVRLRPILMTTLTTVLGLLPMALGIGEGTEIRVPMAVTVIAGLLTSTFLTLIVIPVVYDKFSK